MVVSGGVSETYLPTLFFDSFFSVRLTSTSQFIYSGMSGLRKVGVVIGRSNEVEWGWGTGVGVIHHWFSLGNHI